MRLYDNACPSAYEEIKTWYPVWYRDVLEMDALWRVWGGQLDEIQAGVIQAVDNNFIDYADAETLAKLEEFFHITYSGFRTLAERRNMIKAMILGQGHVGQKEIKELIAVFTDGEIAVELIGGMVRITVTRDLGDNFNLYDCHAILGNRIPAHLALDMVDKLLPVSVFNVNGFVFQNFCAAFTAKNHTAVPDGVRLNGEKTLDGGWTLDAVRAGVQFMEFGAEIPFPNDTMAFAPQALVTSAYRLQNPTSVSAHVQVNLKIGGQGAFHQKSAVFTGLTVKQESGLSGSVVMDGRWSLNGDFILNGSRSLNQIFSKEEL